MGSPSSSRRWDPMGFAPMRSTSSASAAPRPRRCGSQNTTHRGPSGVLRAGAWPSRSSGNRSEARCSCLREPDGAKRGRRTTASSSTQITWEAREPGDARRTALRLRRIRRIPRAPVLGGPDLAARPRGRGRRRPRRGGGELSPGGHARAVGLRKPRSRADLVDVVVHCVGSGCGHDEIGDGRDWLPGRGLQLAWALERIGAVSRA